MTPEQRAERERKLIDAGMDEYQARQRVAIEAGDNHGYRLPPGARRTRGLLAEPAVTRELTAEEQANLEQNRIARGEPPRPVITPEHRARLEADRAAAIRDETLVPTGAPRWLAAALRVSPLPDGARAECTVFPSGAVDLVIHHGDHVASVQGTADGRQWGYSVDPSPDEGLSGHDEVTTLLPSALHAVAAKLGACDPPPAPTRLPVRPGVAGVLDALHERRITLAAAAADFAARDWSVPPASAFRIGEDFPWQENDWAEADAARQMGMITREQYEVLDAARGVIVTRPEPT